MKKKTSFQKSLPNVEPHFVEPMQCKPVSELPQGSRWIYELKFDGYRAIGIKKNQQVELISRNGNNLNRKYPEIVEAMRELPVRSVALDGEIVVLDENGIPSFQRLQDLGFGQSDRSLFYYTFDLINLNGKDFSKLPLLQRKETLQTIIPNDELVRFASHLEGNADVLVKEVRKLGLEGVIAKQKNSFYEPGKRSGAWTKFKLGCEQEFVVGGFRPSGVRDGFDMLLIGYYEGKKLRYAAKLRAGFTPHSKKQIASRFPKLIASHFPFAELPVGKGGRWGEGLTKEDLEKIVWLKPKIVVRAQFVEWTSHGNLRHAKFVTIRDDKRPSEVVREKT
jgi:bifunctional non-homologous end joining protein LigD